MLKVVNYFRERILSEIFDWVLNISPIFKLLRENLSNICSQRKFVSYQNKLLARLSHSSRGTCSLCNIYMSSLKVIFLSISFFLNLWTRTCSSIICITISLSVSLRALWIKQHEDINISNNVLKNVSAIYLTYNMPVICWNSREAKTCWKCIHLFKLDETFIDWPLR